MIGELYYIFCKYGEQIAEKYGYGECWMRLTTDGGGCLSSWQPTATTFGTPQHYQLAEILSWDTLDEGVKLLRKELAGVLLDGGKK